MDKWKKADAVAVVEHPDVLLHLPVARHLPCVPSADLERFADLLGGEVKL
jgi:hypothetical protein